MARRVRTGVAVAVAALAITAVGVADAATTATLTRTESSLLTVMNQVRAANGLRPLRADGRLEQAARAHSLHMLQADLFYHGAFSARIRGVGVRAPRVGENLAWGVGFSRAQIAQIIVNMWLASPSHRENLLHAGYGIVGVGARRGKFGGYRGTLMITTDFAGR